MKRLSAMMLYLIPSIGLIVALFPKSVLAQDWTCGSNTQVSTALGCLNTGDVKQFIGQLLSWGVGLVGLGAFLLIVYGGVIIMSASGDPKKVKAGQELVISAITGVILALLSVIVLNFLGMNILGLGSFGF